MLGVTNKRDCRSHGQITACCSHSSTVLHSFRNIPRRCKPNACCTGHRICCGCSCLAMHSIHCCRNCSRYHPPHDVAAAPLHASPARPVCSSACEAAPNASHWAAPLKHSHATECSWKLPAVVTLLLVSTCGQSAPAGKASAVGRAAAEPASNSQLLLLAPGAAAEGSCAPAGNRNVWQELFRDWSAVFLLQRAEQQAACVGRVRVTVLPTQSEHECLATVQNACQQRIAAEVPN